MFCGGVRARAAEAGRNDNILFRRIAAALLQVTINTPVPDTVIVRNLCWLDANIHLW
jgi:hypothetical protein